MFQAPTGADLRNLQAVNRPAITRAMSILATTSREAAAAATDPAERDHHLAIARLASR